MRHLQKFITSIFLTTLFMTAWPQEHKTVFYDATVIDVQSGRLLKHQEVIVIGNKIVAVQSITKKELHTDAQIINAQGKYIIPGFWDMHVHTLNMQNFKWQFPLLIANGIIGVRDMDGNRQRLDSLKNEMQKGTLPSLHLIASGHILDGKKPFWRGTLSAGDTATAIRLVDSLIDAKVDFIKVYSLLEPDVFDAIAKRCREKNFPFAGHVPNTVWLTTAAKAGMASMEHLYGFITEACAFPDSAMNMIKINTADMEAGADAKLLREKSNASEAFMVNNFSVSRMRNIARVLKQTKTYIVPTEVVNKGYYLSDNTGFTNDKRLAYMSERTRTYWSDRITKNLKNSTDIDWQNRKKEYELEKRMIKILADEKVQIMAGTDFDNPYAFPGFGLHDEMALFVESGMKPIDALRTATINPVKYLKMTDSLGTIEKGKRADFVLLNGNPLTNISNTKNIYAVMINGKLFTSGELDRLKADVLKSNKSLK